MVTYGLCQHHVNTARIMIKTGQLNHDATMRHLKAVYEGRKPAKVINGDIYHLAGKDFRSKDEAIRYAVELAGGLTVTKMTTVAVEV